MRIFLGLIFILQAASCSNFDYKKENKEEIINNRLIEIKKNGLELYPQIKNCKNANSKDCFREQLNIELKNGLTKIKSIALENSIDTIWLSIAISNKGVLSLNKIDKSGSSDIERNIKETLLLLSPIKPGVINGNPVNCTFKIPLILKTVN